MLRAAGLGDEIFAAVIDSQVVGWRKPDRRIFDVALKRLEMDPFDCIHVGDSLRDDVEGARDIGILPVHIEPFGLGGDDDHLHAPSMEAFSSTLLSADPSFAGLSRC